MGQLKEACQKDKRSRLPIYRQILCLISGIALTAAALFVAASMVSVYLPCTPIVLSDVGRVVAVASGTGIMAVGSTILLGISKTEIERALEYIKNLQKNLNELKNAMMGLRCEKRHLPEVEVPAVANLCSSMACRCDQIVNVCDRVIDSTY